MNFYFHWKSRAREEWMMNRTEKSKKQYASTRNHHCSGNQGNNKQDSFGEHSLFILYQTTTICAAEGAGLLASAIHTLQVM